MQDVILKRVESRMEVNTAPVLCVGLNHRTAPLELRERLNYPASALKAALARFGCGHDSRPVGLTEFAILATCNRLELYALATDNMDHPRSVFKALIDFIAETRSVAPVEFESHLYCQAGPEAVEHL